MLVSGKSVCRQILELPDLLRCFNGFSGEPRGLPYALRWNQVASERPPVPDGPERSGMSVRSNSRSKLNLSRPSSARDLAPAATSRYTSLHCATCSIWPERWITRSPGADLSFETGISRTHIVGQCGFSGTAFLRIRGIFCTSLLFRCGAGPFLGVLYEKACPCAGLFGAVHGFGRLRPTWPSRPRRWPRRHRCTTGPASGFQVALVTPLLTSARR